MPHYRLIKETNTEIHANSEGTKHPNAEYLYIDPTPEGFIITFESGRQQSCIADYRYLKKQIIFEKCHITDS